MMVSPAAKLRACGAPYIPQPLPIPASSPSLSPQLHPYLPRWRSPPTSPKSPGLCAPDALQGASAGLRADRSGAGAAAQPRHRKGHRRDGLGHRPAAAAGQFVRAPRRPAQRAHRAQVDRQRASTRRRSAAMSPRAPLDINAELANALGYGQGDPNKSLIDDTAGEPPERDEISDISEPRREKRVMHRPTPQPITLGVTASMEALDKLLREGRPEFAASGGTAVWTPHRPPRPEKSEGGVRIELKSELTPKGDQPTAIKDLVEGARRHDRTQVLLGVTGSGKTFTMAKVIEATQRPAHHPGAEQDARRRSSTASSRASSPTTRSSISSRITTTTSRKPTSRAPTPTSRRIPRSTSRSTACATRRRARCSNATTSSSSPRCRASTASARSRPIRR